MKKSDRRQNGISDEKKLPGRIYEEGSHYDSQGRKVVNFDGELPGHTPQKAEEISCCSIIKPLGITLFIKFKDLSQSSYTQRRELIFEWRGLTARVLKPYIIMLLLCFVAAAFTFMDSISMGLFKAGLLLIFILIYTMIKLNELPGFILHLALNTVWLFTLSSGGNPIISAFTLIAFALMTFISLMCIVCLANFRLYKTLSKLDGFPSFLQNTGDVLGSILHETEIIKAEHKKDPLADLKSYADKNREQNGLEELSQSSQPEPQKGWNAFDYLDTQTPKGDNGNENGN